MRERMAALGEKAKPVRERVTRRNMFRGIFRFLENLGEC